jgi:U3 small nucleolar RNA-associated protein 21
MPEVTGRVTRLLHLSTMMLAISNGRLHVFHIPQQELVGSLDLGEGGDVTAILHPATWLNKVVLGREDGMAQIWNIRTGSVSLILALTVENSSSRQTPWEVLLHL